MSEPFQRVDESLLEISKWKNLNNKLRAGFTTRIGGTSVGSFDSLNLGLHVSDHEENVLANRRLLAHKVAFPLKNWVCAEQTHGINVKVIDSNDKAKGATSFQTAIKDTDGIITNEEGVLCTAFFADCVPLYFFDHKTRYIGIAHAGWKGTVNKIGEKMVQTFQSLGSDINDILVAIGPSISRQNYEVNETVIRHIDPKIQQKVLIFKRDNKYLLDLKQLNVEILLQSGILRHNIDITSYCSFQHDNLFFSYRRDKGKTGRMLGYIGIMEQ